MLVSPVYWYCTWKCDETEALLLVVRTIYFQRSLIAHFVFQDLVGMSVVIPRKGNCEVKL